MITNYLTNRIQTLEPLEQEPRHYIGASIIGSPCSRKIWYEYKNYPSTVPSSQLQRTFDMGKLIEDYIITLLERTGLKITRATPENNKLHYHADDQPYFEGHCDGIIQKPKTILEIKTANNTRFNQVLKHGVKKWSPEYYHQVQAYMGFTGIKKAYVFVFNKNNSTTYDEKINFDEVGYRMLKRKADFIYNSTDAPDRISNTPVLLQCKICKFKEECWK